MQYLPQVGSVHLNNQTNLWYYGFPEEVIGAIKEASRHYPWVSTTWVTPRKTKLGDFRPAHSKQAYPLITLNKNMPTYVALLVWIHEFAHHITYTEHQNRVDAHGPEWKYYFKTVFQDYFKGVFPKDWDKALAQYFKNPTAASFSHPALQPFMSPDDVLQPNELRLAKIPEGSTFIFKNREFVKERPLRSFVLCSEKSTGKKYRIRANCAVQLKTA